MKVIVFLSGGMDSVTALYHAAREHKVGETLSFDYGSKHNHRERRECPLCGDFTDWHTARRQLGVPDDFFL